MPRRPVAKNTEPSPKKAPTDSSLQKASSTQTAGENVDVAERLALPSYPGLDWNQVHKAIVALLQYVKTRDTKKNQLFGDDVPDIQLMFQLFQVAQKPQLYPISVTVPFPFVQPDVEACLIVKDNEWKQKMKEKNVQAKIMTYQKLRDDHDSHEAKKKLVNSYDMFLCDHNMMRLVMNWLGDIAVKAKRNPVPLKRGLDKVAERVEKAKASAYVHIPRGSRVTVVVGRPDQTADELIKNIAAVISKAVDHFPKKWEGIKQIGLGIDATFSLPFFYNASALIQDNDNETDGTAKEETPKKEAPTKETPKKETSEKKTPQKQTPQKQTPQKQTPQKQTPKKQTPQKQTPKEETAKEETPKKEAPTKESPKEDTSEKQTPKKQSPAKQTPNKQTPNKQTPNKQSPNKQTPNKQTPNKQTPNKQTPNKQSPAKQTPNKQSPQQKRKREDTPKKSQTPKKAKI